MKSRKFSIHIYMFCDFSYRYSGLNEAPREFISSQVGEDQSTKNSFAGNCMKCADLYRKLIFTNPDLHRRWGGGPIH